MFRHHFEVNVISLNQESGSMLRNQRVGSKIPTTDQTVYVYACWN